MAGKLLREGTAVTQLPSGYETLEHTADVGIRAWAGNLGELFAQAGAALISVMGRAGPGEEQGHEATVEAGDLDGLMERFLSELLYVFEVVGMAPTRFDVTITGGPLWTAEAKLSGTPVEAFEQDGPAVKAITYHQMYVGGAPSGRGYEARVYLDV